MAEEKNKTLEKARIEMNYLTGDEEVKRLAELREKWEMDYNSGIGHAKREAVKQRNIEIVKEMKKQKYPIEVIAKITKLTEEEIKNIK